MGWFSRKKKIPQQQAGAPPPLPQYNRAQQPTFPDLEDKPVEFIPEEDHTLPTIKPEEKKPKHTEIALPQNLRAEEQPNIELPQRQPAFMKQDYPEREAYAKGEDVLTQDQEDPAAQALTEYQKQQEPPQTQTLPAKETKRGTQDKPIFVKIGQYREATTHIQTLKQTIQSTEELLTKLEGLQSEEQTEINNAKKNLEEIKEKLLNIDKQLFEV